MAQPVEKKLNELLGVVNEIKTDLNALRQDFLRHDHDSNYTSSTVRIQPSDNALMGTAASTDIAATVPEKMYSV